MMEPHLCGMHVALSLPSPCCPKPRRSLHPPPYPPNPFACLFLQSLQEQLTKLQSDNVQLQSRLAQERQHVADDLQSHRRTLETNKQALESGIQAAVASMISNMQQEFNRAEAYRRNESGS